MSQEAGNPPSPLAFVRVRVNIDYDDSAESRKQLKELMDFLKPVKAELRRGETLSALIVRLYGFGPNDRIPQTYQMLESEILRLNHWGKPESAVAGQIDVPHIPRRRGQKRSLDNPYYNVPAIRRPISTVASPGLWAFDSIESPAPVQTYAVMHLLGASNERDAKRTLDEIKKFARRSAESRRSTSFYDMQLVIAESDLRSPRGRKFLNSKSNDVALTSSSMPVQFVLSGNSEQEEYRISAGDKEMISHLLANTPQRIAYLFILDSGWPTPEAYASSRTEIFKMFDIVRQLWKLNPRTNKPSAREFVEPSNTHCQKVATSLEAFQTLDQNTKRVPVIYFPLTLEQDSEAILEELLWLSSIADQMRDKLGEKAPKSDTVRNARAYAQAVIKRLPRDACSPKVNGICTSEVNTDDAILEALWVVADALTKKDAHKPIYLINESWIVRNDVLAPRRPGVPHGIAVVAAGNNETIVNSDSDGVDFARQCYPANYTLTVLNMDAGNGLKCKSSKVKDNPDILGQTMVTAYDGSIKDDCGTSFASPRVAWLIALSEAYRTFDLERSDWASDVQKRLIKTRSNSPGLQSLIFDLREYLRQSRSIQDSIP
jgi:hypothetical protein